MTANDLGFVILLLLVMCVEVRTYTRAKKFKTQTFEK